MNSIATTKGGTHVAHVTDQARGAPILQTHRGVGGACRETVQRTGGQRERARGGGGGGGGASSRALPRDHPPPPHRRTPTPRRHPASQYESCPSPPRPSHPLPRLLCVRWWRRCSSTSRGSTRGSRRHSSPPTSRRTSRSASYLLPYCSLLYHLLLTTHTYPGFRQPPPWGFVNLTHLPLATCLRAYLPATHLQGLRQLPRRKPGLRLPDQGEHDAQAERIRLQVHAPPCAP